MNRKINNELFFLSIPINEAAQETRKKWGWEINLSFLTDIYKTVTGKKKKKVLKVQAIENLEEEIAAEEAGLDHTRELAGSARPRSRPLLSSTRDSINGATSVADLDFNLTDVAYPGSVVPPATTSDPFLTFDESLHAATDELIDSIIQDLPESSGEAPLTSPLLECERPKRIRSERSMEWACIFQVS